MLYSLKSSWVISCVRCNLCVFQIDEWDMFAFCGTTTGDIVKIKLNYAADTDILDPVATPLLLGCFAKCVPKKRLATGVEPARYSQGEFALTVLLVQFIWTVLNRMSCLSA
jgi:hypothetical protein